MSFLWYRGGRSLLFGIEISFLVSRFCILLFSIYIVLFLGSTCLCFFGPRHPVKWRSKKISIPKRRPKNLDTLKKTSRYQLKESPDVKGLLILVIRELSFGRVSVFKTRVFAHLSLGPWDTGAMPKFLNFP